MEAFWSACKLQNHRERLALAELERTGFATYCPRIQKRRFSKGKKIVIYPLLFPNYVFVQIVLQWHKVQRTPGVVSLIMDGNERPARVPDVVIGGLKGREVNGLIVLPKKLPPVQAVGFRAGDRVRIKAGVFQGLFGLYETQSAEDRVKILMTLFAGPRSVEFDAADIVKV